MTILPYAVLAVLLAAVITKVHRWSRAREEREIVVENCISCGQPFDFVCVVGHKTLRRCPDGHIDIRFAADTCPDRECGGHLAYLREESRDHETCYRYKVCDKCGQIVTFVVRLSACCRKLLKQLETRTAA